MPFFGGTVCNGFSGWSVCDPNDSNLGDWWWIGSQADLRALINDNLEIVWTLFLDLICWNYSDVESSVAGCQLAIGVPVAFGNVAIKNWEQVYHKEKWKGLKVARHTKLSLPKPNKQFTKFIMMKSRKTFLTLISLSFTTLHRHVDVCITTWSFYLR